LLGKGVECKKCGTLFTEGWEIKIFYDGDLVGIDEPIEIKYICLECSELKF